MTLTALGLSLLALPAAMALRVFDVAVGLEGLVYTPEYVNAEPGDIVNFVFHPKNHTVTQNSFDAPCVPLEGAINSGFMSVPAEVTGLPNFPVLVNDTKPVWFHCEQTGHCGKGMVFAINPPPDPNAHSFSAEKALAIAINGTASDGTSKSTSKSYNAPTNHMVTVGKDGKLRYDPEYITAAVGDTVTYQFFPKNHTVTQSNFAEPCQPKADTSPDHTPGFDSGFMPVAADDASPHHFTITVNDTNPIWAYCRQVGHCGSGMVMGINPPSSGNTFDAFQALAEKTNGTSSNATTTPTNHMVTVGKDGKLRYDPEYITAAVGDTVTFEFFPKNHSVTQSNFAEPCQPKADTSPDHTPGFDSGFMPVAADDASPHHFTITVNDTTPIWAYCRQVGHCGSGMVMGINPPSSGNTFDAFQMLAEKTNGTSTTTTPTNHMVTVGKDGKLRYDPEYITAAVGDTVTYQFFPKNHTVTQSNFAEPCQPKADTSPDHTPGFDSGFMPVAADDASPHHFTITVNDTNPIWAYCRQVGHCGSGMVMGINPPSSGNTFDAFQMLAEKTNGTSSASAPAPTSTGYGSTYSSSTNDGSTAKGALENAAADGSSLNVGDLTRNTYIIIGLLCAVLLGLIVMAVFMLFRGNRGYKAVPNVGSRSAPDSDILPYSQKGPYSTPYSTADAEEYRD